MSLMQYNQAAGLSALLKDGTRHEDSSGSASVLLQSIDASLQLTHMLATSLGPQGRSKLVVNHLEKRIVTSDAAAILKEIQLQHPAAQILATAATQQATEVGDGSNLVLALAGAVLEETAGLVHKMSTWQPELLVGYQNALQLMEDYIQNELVAETVSGLTVDSLTRLLKPVVASKQYGSEDMLAPLVSQACCWLLEQTKSIDADSIRTCKIPGGRGACTLVRGFVAPRPIESIVTAAPSNAKIAVFASGIEASSTEASGKVVLKDADALLQYNLTEQAKMKEIIESIYESGVRVVVTGGNVSDMAWHFLNECGMVVVRLGSKFELRRLCRAVGATALVRLGAPTPDEMGVGSVEQRALGDKTITVIESPESSMATLVLRASTPAVLEDLERAVDASVQTAMQLLKDGRLVHGGGCVEMALSMHLLKQTAPGLQTYAYQALAQALQVVPRTLAENAGYNATQVVADLKAAHSSGKSDLGVDIEGESSNGLTSMKDVLDVLSTKLSAYRLAIDAATTIMKIDQIIMAKQAGGGGGP